MNPEDQISFHIVQQKLGFITDLLRDLSTNHDFHFNLNYSLLAKDSKKIITLDRLVNSNINVPLLGMFAQELIQYKEDREFITRSIAQGSLIVMCHDVSARPEGVKDWLIQGACYLVESVYNTYEVNGCNLFRLAGLDSTPYQGYKSSRFTQLFTSFNQN